MDTKGTYQIPLFIYGTRETVPLKECFVVIILYLLLPMGFCKLCYWPSSLKDSKAWSAKWACGQINGTVYFISIFLIIFKNILLLLLLSPETSHLLTWHNFLLLFVCCNHSLFSISIYDQEDTSLYNKYLDCARKLPSLLITHSIKVNMSSPLPRREGLF